MTALKFAKQLATGAAASLCLVSTASLAVAGTAGMDWIAPLDHYCERIAPGLLGEPLNALSNVAFLIGAGIAIQRAHGARRRDPALLVLAFMAASVGVGSILFHTFANRWSLYADMIPIALFIYSFFFIAAKRLLQLSNVSAGLATVALVVLTPILETLFRPLLGASAAYAPGLVVTLGVAAAAAASGKGFHPLLVAAGAAFSIALVFRILDLPACGALPTGTHFLWHIFNAVALTLGLIAIHNAASDPVNFGSTAVPKALVAV